MTEKAEVIVEIIKASPRELKILNKAWNLVGSNGPDQCATLLSGLMTLYVVGFDPEQRKEMFARWVEAQNKLFDIYTAEDEARGATKQ